MTSTHWCWVELSLVYQHSAELASVIILHDNMFTCFCEDFMHSITYIVFNKKCALHFYPNRIFELLYILNLSRKVWSMKGN